MDSIGGLLGGGSKGGEMAAAAAGVTAKQRKAALESLAPYMEGGQYAQGVLESMVLGIPFGQTGAGRAMAEAGIDIPPELLNRGALEMMQATPGYQSRLAEGEKAIGRLQSARGDLMSGRVVKEAQRYGQDYAASEYDKVLQRLGQLSDVGRQTAYKGADVRTTTAGTQGQFATQYGQMKDASQAALGQNLGQLAGFAGGFL